MHKKPNRKEHQLEDSVSYVDRASEVPEAQQDVFEEFVFELAASDREETTAFSTNKEWVDRVLKLRKKYKVHPRKAQLKKLYEKLVDDGTILERNLNLEEYLTIKKSRSLSGVLVIAVMMSPYPRYFDERTGTLRQQRFSCAHNCYYCPNEPGMPRSYLSSEAAVARASRVNFDAIDQFYCRANTLQKLGHDVDKIELLILGGTFCQYPQKYCEQFIRDLFWAANTFYDGHSNFANKRARHSLAEEIKIHEVTSKCRIIGMTIETRPDTICDYETIRSFRQYGATRLQMGVQHTDDGILKTINRGCTHSDTLRGIRLLKNAGYKIDIHLMPNLPDSTPEVDSKMFDDILEDELMQVDQWKVYPTQTVDFTVLQKWYDSGKYAPYSLEEMMEVIIGMKARIAPWIRLNRIFRALPVEHIQSGITMSNFRQHMFAKMEQRGLRCKCIRCREIGTHIRRASKQKRSGRNDDGEQKDRDEALRRKLAAEPVLKRRHYKSSGGDEVFISFESEDETVLMGFVRLRLPPQWIDPRHRSSYGLQQNEPFLDGFELPEDGRYGDIAEYEELIRVFPMLYRAALVREAHVYGAKQKKKETENKDGFGGSQSMASQQLGESSDANKVRDKKQLTAQNKGYGSRLMAEAEKIANDRGYARIAVIAGVGTRLYYRHKLGYRVEGSYMVKDLDSVAMGIAGRGNVDSLNKQALWMVLVLGVVALLGAFTVLWSVSVVVAIVLGAIYLAVLDYLHFVHIQYGEDVNHSLLRLSRVALLLLNLCVICKIMSAFAPNLGGVPAYLGFEQHCFCQQIWTTALVSYVAAFYLLKMILVKRVILLIQSPLFGNDCGNKNVSSQIGALCTTQVLAFTVCEFLVMNFSNSHCTEGGTTGYDAESVFGCHDSFGAIATWVAIAAIFFDFAMFSMFCLHWYAIMLILMEEIAVTLQWQCMIVCLSMVSCVIDASYHMSLFYLNDEEHFDSFQGTFAFILDVSVIAITCVLSFTDSLQFVFDKIGVDSKKVHQALEDFNCSLPIGKWGESILAVRR